MKNMQRQSMSGARITIGAMCPVEQVIEGLPSRTEIADAIGLTNDASLSEIVRHSIMRLQLHLVAKRVATELSTWHVDAVADVVAYAIEHRHGAALVLGDLTVDDVLDLMDESEAA